MNFRPYYLTVFLILGLAASPAAAQDGTPVDEIARWQTQAQQVFIQRDDWGIAHIHGKSDADAVFGMVYAEAEDDFNRIEINYLNALGRMAEAEGESAIWTDLRARLFVEDADLKSRYAKSPAWLRTLMQAWADGLNYYLATHPEVKPRALAHFEPWMALSFTEGSIGGDVERITSEGLADFYGKIHILPAHAATALFREPSGSNGIAIAPSDSASGHALLLINPHTSFYFRAEMKVESDQGLNAYGAATWGQFFIYQGFNAHAGWMHTSSSVDVVDEFVENVHERNGKLFYRYGGQELPMQSRRITIAYRTASGAMEHHNFDALFTRHGPIVRTESGKWISISLMYRPVEALSQSFLRTKANNLKEFQKASAFNANSSNNTVFADDAGEIALLYPQFIPKRDNRFDYNRPVDGADPATDWRGLDGFAETPHVIDPKTGWLFNTNDGPYSAAGPDSPKEKDFPKYMDTAGENPRALHALKILQEQRGFTLDGLVAAAYDSYLPAFARMVPTLLQSYDRLDANDPRKSRLAESIALLGGWDYRWSADSTATSLAVFWGEALYRATNHDPNGESQAIYEYQPIYEILAGTATDQQKLDALEAAVARLKRDFGDWKTPWGEINRFQRLDDTVQSHFDDTKPSIPVPFTSAEWGSLAAYGAQPYPNTKKYYGDFGNSFVAAVEFGPKVKARAVMAGGESGDTSSAHFRDQGPRYASGDLRAVYFYPEDLKGHVERRYHPGEQ
jgi:acyl-homoserine-lactone acylase